MRAAPLIVLAGLVLFEPGCSSQERASDAQPDDVIAMTSPSDASAEAAPDVAVDEGPRDACPAPPADPVKAAYLAVDPARLLAHLKIGSGVAPVTLADAGMVTITNRYAPASKAKFRAYFEQTMDAYGVPWTESTYPTAHVQSGETSGHNVEAVLAGKSNDSIVVIIHYDSMGPSGMETSNPGADDDLTGVASMLEAARIFSQPCVAREKTIRFVLTDFEEWLNPGLEGARVYAKAIKQKAANDGFQIVAAIDFEQSGWNCAADKLCSPETGGVVFDVSDCSGDAKMFKSTALGDAMQKLTATLGSPLSVARTCLAQNSDHYAMWEIGVPSIVTSEHMPLSNPHFDYKGGDTLDKIDLAYHAEIARLSVAFTAELAGVQ